MAQDLIWEETHPAIEYSEGWTREWGSIYHGSAVMRTRRVGDSMSVKFRGSSIKLMGAQGWDHGTFSVSLDGVEEIIHDGYCCGPRGGAPQIIQFEKTGLDTSEHVLNVTNLARGMYGSVLEVDAVL
ncbi:hypothetical protein FB45DRAFT_121179 [Roridomyces roridus]|uniref:Uncharacterized protein n=1 Tax=Roridomyces roridus TaxID=1738132 RepID=A0AAD7BI88_9AGAR|nr:hypothetical protein FB45DRAFT_121179 [Roridomyces roridus]